MLWRYCAESMLLLSECCRGQHVEILNMCQHPSELSAGTSGKTKKQLTWGSITHVAIVAITPTALGTCTLWWYFQGTKEYFGPGYFIFLPSCKPQDRLSKLSQLKCTTTPQQSYHSPFRRNSVFSLLIHAHWFFKKRFPKTKCSFYSFWNLLLVFISGCWSNKSLV